MSGKKREERLVQVNVHGAKMSAVARSVKDLAYNELDYYQAGRNEPVPPDANIVSAVKQKKKQVMIRCVKKSAAEKKQTEMRVDACLSRTKRKERSIPIPAYDPLGATDPEDDEKESGIGAKADISSEIGVMTELELFIDEFKEKSMAELPTVKFAVVSNDQNFSIKIQDGSAEAELRKLQTDMKKYFLDSLNDKAAPQIRKPLTLGGFYVHRIREKNEDSYIRVQVMAIRERISVFLCDEGFEMNIDKADDLYPLFPEWADLPQLACWAQIAPGSSYMKVGVDENFKKQYLEKSCKILKVGKESVYKYSDPLEPVVVACARICIIESAGDLQRCIPEF